jgi:hypothetical protein
MVWLNNITALHATGSRSLNQEQHWRYFYFLGIRSSTHAITTLTQFQTNTILDALEVKASINCGALIEPKHLLNRNGMTPWTAMLNLLAAKDQQLLQDTATGITSAHLPAEFIAKLFDQHVAWEDSELDGLHLTLPGYRLFFCPFLIHDSNASSPVFDRTMKLEDHSVEIFGCREFSANSAPKQLLEEMDILVRFLKDSRPELIRH